MKKRFFLIPALSLLLLFSFITFPSCTKETDKTKTEKTGELTGTSEFAESNEDLLTVDYTYFYKELSGKGEWIEMSAKDLGINVKPGSALNDYGTHKLIAEILGIKTAHAQTDEQLANIFVWRPLEELASTMVAENENKQYVPYNDGQWLYTDEGWYFKANTPEEDLTSHYGRWTEDPNLGYVWVPGKVYSPAWVDWRQNADYVAWAPVPPGVYVENDAVKTQTIINENRYTIVEKKQFMEPSVYKYRYQYVENKNKIMIKEMTMTDGVIVKNKTVINKGPEVADIEKATGKKIEQIKIKKTDKKDEAGLNKDELGVYTPQFTKTTEVKKEPVSKPEKLVSYKDAKKITKEEKQDLKGKDKEMKKEEKEMKKEEKELKKEGKQEKKEDKQIKKEEKQKDKEKGKDKEKNKEDKGKDKQDKGEKGNKDKNDKDKGEKGKK